MQINVPYTPVPAAVGFHSSNARNKLAVGGKRSSKTFSMLIEGLMLSFEYPGNVGLLARETFGETQEAIIDPLLKICPEEIIKSRPTVQRKTLEFTNGSIIYFRGLDEHRKSKGLTLGWVGIDEVDSVTEEDLIQLDGQISLSGARPVLMATTNPVSTNHWVYKRWVLGQYPGYAYFRFPTQDNALNLPDGYIAHMMATMPESWVRRYLEGRWGSIVVGERVHPEFSEKLHVYPGLVYNSAIPIIRTWDFGNNMAVIFSQQRDKIGLDVLNEVFKQHLTAQQFSHIIARFSKEKFPGAVFEDYGDIAGRHTESTSGMSPIDVVNKELKINIQWEQIPLKDSLDFVSTKLSQIVGGVTAIRISPEAKLTIEALDGGYVWQKNRDGSIKNGVPASDETFEHIMDAFRYTIWHKFAFNRPEQKRDFNMPPAEDFWREYGVED
jgi:hypothetical protein